MSCDCAQKVSLLIDGELPPNEEREVQRHLLSCLECQQLRDDFLGLRQQLVSYPATLDREVQQRALTAIIGKQTNERARRSQWLGLQLNFGRATLAFASLLVIGLIVGVVTYRNTLQKKNPNYIAATGHEQQRSPVAAPGTTTQHNQQPTVATSASSSQPTPLKNRIYKQKHVEGGAANPKPTAVQPTSNNNNDSAVATVRSADSETMTAMHFESSELLLRSFRNVRLDEPGTTAEVGYEKKKAQQLVYQNMMLRREADAAGDVQTATLLESLEPILIDIANLPDKPESDDIRAIKERVERKNIVPLLQVNSTALARGLD